MNRQTEEAGLDSFTDNAAVLDQNGCIIAVNASWHQFCLENGGKVNEAGVGTSYIAVCERAARESPEAAAARDGILKVINGHLPVFRLEYPCDSADTKRYFLLHFRN